MAKMIVFLNTKTYKFFPNENKMVWIGYKWSYLDLKLSTVLLFNQSMKQKTKQPAWLHQNIHTNNDIKFTEKLLLLFCTLAVFCLLDILFFVLYIFGTDINL